MVGCSKWSNGTAKLKLDMDAQGRLVCLTVGGGSQSVSRQRRHCAFGNACDGGGARWGVDG